MSKALYLHIEYLIGAKGIGHIQQIYDYVLQLTRKSPFFIILISLLKFKQGLDGDVEHAGHLECKHG
jgi:hypothetical protein